ncbi:2-succinyl-6-hydroxy-2,4-cyclohexadiene-1-carboxylate synthase [Ectobacillus antri]|uniref:2-succinyl-6-hydroxy-2, 4-cyclohexadiene-1-carboxylate synthase n=1 Tax=Ectobacillus antri TaxID=2486280 RepID=UPI000F59318D|nr:2-succinyl-6-hydroxy-2,4-cyclohexadiene-1-carboxylate synthase [Ectobacillus antri]
MKIEINGLVYAYETYGEGEPLLVLHGFTGCKESWRPFSWQTDYHIIAVDLPGHGETDAPSYKERYKMEQVAADLAELLTILNVDKAHVLGYSMGGRLAIAFACLYPERVRTLVLENCTAGLETEVEREARIRQDEELAKTLLQDGVATFIEKWERIPLFASQDSLPKERKEQLRQQRLRNSPVGLAGSLRGMGTGAQPSFWEELKHLCMPVLLLSGAYDEKFFHILSRMKEKLPDAQFVQISDAGHAIHVEQPEKFDTIVREFLQSHKEGIS